MSQQRPYAKRLFLCIFALIVVSGCSYSRTDKALSLIYKTSYGEIHCGSTPSSTEAKLESAVLDTVTRIVLPDSSGDRAKSAMGQGQTIEETLEYKHFEVSFDQALTKCKEFLSAED